MPSRRRTCSSRNDQEHPVVLPQSLARQRLASEAGNFEAGDAGHLRTAGRPEDEPKSNRWFPARRHETADDRPCLATVLFDFCYSLIADMCRGRRQLRADFVAKVS